MSNLPMPYYYNEMTAKERSYADYIGKIGESINFEIEKNANEIKSTLIDNQIATENALYNHTQQLDSSINSGFSCISRQLGAMDSSMNMGFAFLNSAVQESSKAICNKLDDINETLKNPLFTESRELYNRALKNYNKGLYEEAIEDLQEAVKKNKTEPLSYFLMGQTYMRGISEFSNVIDISKSIEALRNAAKYITSDAKAYPEVRPMAAEIYFYLGLAHYTKANDDLHNSNTSDCQKHLNEAKEAYKKSYDYSPEMLESLYNFARCEALTNDEDGAIRNLIAIMLKDHGYCLKTYAESDFSSDFKHKLYSQLKDAIYPKLKEDFDSIQNLIANFKAPYSQQLAQLINTHLPNTFTKDTPPFDMLEASIYFPEILKSVKEISKRVEELSKKIKDLTSIRERIAKFQKCISCVTHTVGLKADGRVIAVGDNSEGECNTQGWMDIVAVSASGDYSVGLKADGTVVAIGYNKDGRCNTQDWRDIGPVSVEELRREAQGLCRYCGGQLGGLFTKKCKSCGRPAP